MVACVVVKGNRAEPSGETHIHLGKPTSYWGNPRPSGETQVHLGKPTSIWGNPRPSEKTHVRLEKPTSIWQNPCPSGETHVHLGKLASIWKLHAGTPMCSQDILQYSSNYLSATLSNSKSLIFRNYFQFFCHQMIEIITISLYILTV